MLTMTSFCSYVLCLDSLKERAMLTLVLSGKCPGACPTLIPVKIQEQCCSQSSYPCNRHCHESLVVAINSNFCSFHRPCAALATKPCFPFNLTTFYTAALCLPGTHRLIEQPVVTDMLTPGLQRKY